VYKEEVSPSAGSLYGSEETSLPPGRSDSNSLHFLSSTLPYDFDSSTYSRTYSCA